MREKNTTTSIAEKSRSYLFLLRLYHSLVVFAFSLALTTVLISTAASVTILHARHYPKAQTPHELLRREFDYEYCVTRWCFIMALQCFVLAVTLKLILEFELLAQERRFHLVALTSLMMAVLGHALSYVNRTLHSWSNLWELTLHVGFLVWNEAVGKEGEPRPLLVVSLVSSLVSVLAIIKITLFPTTEKENPSNNDAPKTKAE